MLVMSCWGKFSAKHFHFGTTHGESPRTKFRRLGLTLDTQLESCELILVRKILSFAELFRYTSSLLRHETSQRTVNDTILDESPYPVQVPIIIHRICEMDV